MLKVQGGDIRKFLPKIAYDYGSFLGVEVDEYHQQDDIPHDVLEEVREQLAILLRCSYVLESSINNESELDSGDNDGGEGDSGPCQMQDQDVVAGVDPLVSWLWEM